MRIMKQRIDEITMIRGLSIIGILILHVTSYFVLMPNTQTLTFKLGLLFNQVVRFSLPLFLVISGVVLAYSYDPAKGVDFRKFILSRAKQILLPYLTWSFIYFCFYILFLKKVPLGTTVVDLKEPLELMAAIKIFTKNLVFGWNYVHLYFVVLIFQFYLLYPWFIKKVTKIKSLEFFVATNLVFYLILIIYLFYYRGYFGIYLIDLLIKYYWETFIAWFVYFVVGIYVGLRIREFKDWCNKNFLWVSAVYFLTTLIVLGEAFFYVDNVGKLTSLRPAVYLNTIPAMCFYYSISNRLIVQKSIFSAFLKTVGDMSFGIFFVHILILTIAFKGLIAYNPAIFNFNQPSFIFILSFITLAGSMAFVFLIKRIPLSYVFLGKK